MVVRIAKSSALQALKGCALLPVKADPLIQCLAPRISRSMATETQLPMEVHQPFVTGLTRRVFEEKNLNVTIYDFPSMEPLRFTEYSANQLGVPLRRDLLHRAVVYEADGKRQGSASTKWRSEVHGSNKKIRPQKGTGKARLGNKKSPMLRGGGVAFGPQPRDFSTKLPRKIYDQAWRIALSYRYKKGELVVVQKFDDNEVRGYQWIGEVMNWNHFGRPDGKSMVITRRSPANFLKMLNTGEKKGKGGEHGEAISDADVDVTDLLSLGRVIIEKRALDSILAEHSSDINRVLPTAVYD